MQGRNWFKSTVIAGVMSLTTPTFGSAGSNMLFILDGSNSMWGQVDGVAKIETAKDVLGGFLSDLQPSTKVGLMAYGHRVSGDCTDVEALAGVGLVPAAAINEIVQAIVPTGKTPIAYSLQQSAASFSGLKEENNHVVIISDGIETCGGDPCSEAAKLATQGINVKVHVVGFDVSSEARAQLECIAQAGGGHYFDAANTATFREAIVEVEQVTQVSSGAEPEPELVEFFRDDFEAEELGEHWDVEIPDPDFYIPEDGELLVISSTGANFKEGNIPNLFRLNTKFPKGDWTATAKFEVEFQSQNDRVFFGLYEDNENYLVTTLSLYPSGGSWALSVTTEKVLKGAVTTSSKAVWSVPRSDNMAADMGTGQPYLIRLERKGREYTGSIRLEGAEKPEWIILPSIRLLRPKGELAIGAFQTPGGSGEVALLVDWVKIEVGVD